MPSLPDVDITEVQRLFLMYLSSTSEEEQRALELHHPGVFVPEIIASLSEAREEMRETAQNVRETFGTMDAIASSLDMPHLRGSDAADVGPALENVDSFFLQEFTKSLRSLQEQVGVRGYRGPALVPLPSGRQDTSDGATTGAQPWYFQGEVVLEVLSYLPANDILCHAEDVCTAWRYWLFAPEVSRAFWIGVARREFPSFVRDLVELNKDREDVLLQSDWRSLVMLCVTNAESPQENESSLN